jgi:hypothetical protein
MSKNTDFNDINYRLLEDFNEEESYDSDKEEFTSPENNIPDKFQDCNTASKLNDTLYESALETNRIEMNIENLNNEKINLNKKRNSNFTNTTVYKRKDSENHDNKFVDPDTLNSYLTISDLHDNAKDNVNILRSNLQKIDDRDSRLQEMETKTENLMHGADKFKQRSNFLKNKMFWANVFNWLLVAFFIFLIVFLITKLR